MTISTKVFFLVAAILNYLARIVYLLTSEKTWGIIFLGIGSSLFGPYLLEKEKNKKDK